MSPRRSLLEEFADTGVLEAVDIHVAEAVGRLGGESDDDVLLAVALASRAPRHGHVCVQLDQVAQRVAGEDGGADPGGAQLPWPAPRAWSRALSASPVVRTPGDDAPTPLVLEGGRLYLDRYWGYQERLARQLTEFGTRTRDDVSPAAIRTQLDRLFPINGEDGLDRQRLAAALAAVRDLTVISGGPGTGKTTTIVKVLALLLGSADDGVDRRLRIALAAPTGKAAARMQEAIREALPRLPVDEGLRAELAELPAGTLHRLLGWRSDNSTRFRHDADEPLPYDVVVVDEASMVSLSLMAKLVDAIPTGGRLVLVGDRDQLASVEAGAVLGDICGQLRSPGGRTLRMSSQVAELVGECAGLDVTAEADIVGDRGIWDSIVQLERFYRFGPETGIGGVARAIQRIDDSSDEVIAFLTGAATEQPDLGRYDDVELVGPADGDVPDHVRDRIVAGYQPLVEAALGGDDPLRILALLERQRVLTPLRRGPQGTGSLNPRIEGWLAATVGGFDPRGPWYLGRPIIITENDYGARLFNGDVGVVVRHPDDHSQRAVAFPTPDGDVRFVGPARLPDHETVFAMTVHKAQGSQFDEVFVLLPTVDSPVLTRELIYTAVTRAERRVTIVSGEEVLRGALARPVQRASGLADQLWGCCP